jgi:hypothetical protein
VRSLVIVVALVVACGSSKESEHKPDVTPGAPAGDVTEVAGDVKATRAGATRALALHDVVSGDDVITTGADARVTIVLRHNKVPWSLGPSKTKQVSDSAAWTATAAAGTIEVADDKSAAAGRHAERSATETSATAPTAPTNTAPPPPTVEPTGGLGMTGTGPGGGGEGTIGLGTIGTIGHGAGGGEGQGYGRLGGAHVAAAPQVRLDITTEGKLPKEIARRIVRQNLGRVRLCYENALRNNPSEAGKLVVQFVVGADGQVVSSVVASTELDDSASGCVSRGMTNLQFPSFEGITKVTATLTFAPS